MTNVLTSPSTAWPWKRVVLVVLIVAGVIGTIYTANQFRSVVVPQQATSQQGKIGSNGGDTTPAGPIDDDLAFGDMLAEKFGKVAGDTAARAYKEAVAASKEYTDKQVAVLATKEEVNSKLAVLEAKIEAVPAQELNPDVVGAQIEKRLKEMRIDFAPPAATPPAKAADKSSGKDDKLTVRQAVDLELRRKQATEKCAEIGIEFNEQNMMPELSNMSNEAFKAALDETCQEQSSLTPAGGTPPEDRVVAWLDKIMAVCPEGHGLTRAAVVKMSDEELNEILITCQAPPVQTVELTDEDVGELQRIAQLALAE
jgi:hypothetical protein